MIFLLWNEKGQFLGHCTTQEESFTTPYAEFVVLVSDENKIRDCWFTHRNGEGRNWYNVRIDQFALEFLRTKIAAAGVAVEGGLKLPGSKKKLEKKTIEAPQQKKWAKRWHWNSNN